jgi:hypothetical protein
VDLPIIVVPLPFTPELRSDIFVVRFLDGNALLYESVKANMLPLVGDMICSLIDKTCRTRPRTRIGVLRVGLREVTLNADFGLACGYAA